MNQLLFTSSSLLSTFTRFVRERERERERERSSHLYQQRLISPLRSVQMINIQTTFTKQSNFQVFSKYFFISRKFRVISASVFLCTFASDRSHMKRPNGDWIQGPPDYPPIRTAGTAILINIILKLSINYSLPVSHKTKACRNKRH